MDLRPSKTLSFFPAIPSGCVKDLVQEKTGFPRFRLTLLLEDGKSWEELGKPHEVQAVYNQVATDMAEDLLHLGQTAGEFAVSRDTTIEILPPLLIESLFLFQIFLVKISVGVS